MKAQEKKALYTFFRTAFEAMEGAGCGDDWPAFIDDDEMTSPFEKERHASQSSSGISTNMGDNISPYIIEDCVQKRVEKEWADGAKNAKSYGFLEEIKEDVAICKQCNLCEGRKKTVFGDGPKDANDRFISPPILVIGEAPGADEDAQGLPFVGQSGKLLDKMLMAIGLSRTSNCFITNMVKCRPPHNRNPQNSEIEYCSHFLNEQMRLLQPKMILILGTVALKAILKTNEGISHLHGKLFQYTTAEGSSIPTIATYHPSALLRDENLKRPAWDDLKFFRLKMTQYGIL